MRISGHQWPPASKSCTQGLPSFVMVILGDTFGSGACGEIPAISCFMSAYVKIMIKKK